MEEREQLQDDAGRGRPVGRRRFLAGGVFGALAALLGRAPVAAADTGGPNTGGPIIGGTFNTETATTTLVVPTPDTVGLQVNAFGPAVSAASFGDSGVVASSFPLQQPPPPTHLPRAASVAISDAVGLIAAGGLSGPSSLTLTAADARVGIIVAGGLDGPISVTLTANSSVGMIAAGGLAGGIGLTATAEALRVGVIGHITNREDESGVSATHRDVSIAHALGVGGIVLPPGGVGVAGSVGGAPLGGPTDASVGVAGSVADEGIAVSGSLFGAIGTSPLASAALAIARGVTLTALGGTFRSPDVATGGLFLGDIGILAASFIEPQTATTNAGQLATYERTGIVGITDGGTAAHFEALGDGIGVEVVGPSVFDGPVTFTVGGHATIPKGKKSVIVRNPNIGEQDLVTVTLNGQPGLEIGLQYVVCRDGSFTVWLNNYAGRATPFSWVAFRIG